MPTSNDSLRRNNGCGSYECAPVRRDLNSRSGPSMRITGDELASTPLPPPRAASYHSAAMSPIVLDPPPRTNRLAIAALIIAVLGIPLFGAVTGLVAAILGSIALGKISQTRQRGMWMAMTGVLLGLTDVVGWVVFISLALSGAPSRMQIIDFEPDPAALENLPPAINRALRANVLIEVSHGWRGGGIGSGVILHIDGGEAIIVTNRHVADPNFSPSEPGGVSDRKSEGSLTVKLLDQPALPGEILWLAPDGIDLALVSVPVTTKDARSAIWDEKSPPSVGDEVFSIGNPQHLDWSTSRGILSQTRVQTRGHRKVRVYQTDTAINPGNSGGGLYDKNGNLIGINTWTNDKRFSEGISFAITFQTLLDLDPPPLRGIGPAKEGKQP